MRSFDPFNWYWLHTDGRIYSSAASSLVEASDAAYVAWLAPGDVIPTAWPRDENGEQTDAALQDVLTPYGLYLTLIDRLAAYAADRRWRAETGGIVVAGVPIATDDRSKTMIMGARIKADADPEYSVGWKAGAAFVQLAAAQIVAISDAVLAHVDACFSAEAAVLAAIEAGAVTTTENVDAWPWPGAGEEE